MQTDLEGRGSGLECVGHFLVVGELVAELVDEQPSSQEVIVHDHVEENQ